MHVFHICFSIYACFSHMFFTYACFSNMFFTHACFSHMHVFHICWKSTAVKWRVFSEDAKASWTGMFFMFSNGFFMEKPQLLPTKNNDIIFWKLYSYYVYGPCPLFPIFKNLPVRVRLGYNIEITYFDKDILLKFKSINQT